MRREVVISPIDPLIAEFEIIATEARQQGYAFIDRLMIEAKSGKNTFSKSGETFCGVFDDDALVGCGGINQDPYVKQDVGRLRHLYILSEFRRKGVASALVKDLLKRSKTSFRIIRLGTSDDGADKFYEALGFRRIHHESATHLIKI